MRYMIFPPLQRSLWCLHAFAQFWLNSDLLPGPIHCGTTVNAKPGSTIEEELAQSNRPGTWPTLFWLGCVAWQVLRMSHKLSCHERCFGQLKASVLSFRACKSLQPRSTSTYSLLHMFVISLSASSSSVSVSVVWWYQPYQWKPLESHLVHQISPNIFSQEVWLNLVLEGGVTIRLSGKHFGDGRLLANSCWQWFWRGLKNVLQFTEIWDGNLQSTIIPGATT